MSAADQAISQSVNNALRTAGVTTPANFNVRTMNGLVFLTGQANSQAEKEQIETQVRQTPGVRTVVNQLTVGPNSSPSGTGTSTPGGSTGAPEGSTGTGTGGGTGSDTGPSPR